MSDGIEFIIGDGTFEAEQIKDVVRKYVHAMGTSSITLTNSRMGTPPNRVHIVRLAPGESLDAHWERDCLPECALYERLARRP